MRVEVCSAAAAGDAGQSNKFGQKRDLVLCNETPEGAPTLSRGSLAGDAILIFAVLSAMPGCGCSHASDWTKDVKLNSVHRRCDADFERAPRQAREIP
jgi:hypothetical protein